MPTATDLVTDLPADFAVFGQAVATSMADLLGGTTGQILSKATNTDMDFTWTTPNPGDITGVAATSPLTGGGTSGDVTIGIQSSSTTQSGAVQLEDSTSSTSTTKAATPNSVKTSYDLANAAIAKTTVTTAGDIIYRNATVPTRLGIGTAGQVLKVNSGATAPEWATASSGALTLIKKATFSGAVNSGTTFDSTLSATYDNYVVVFNGLGAATGTDDFQLQLRYAGPTTQATNYITSNSYQPWNSSAVFGGNNNGNFFIMQDLFSGCNGVFNILNLSSGTPNMTAQWYTLTYQQMCTAGGYQYGSRTYTGFIISSSSSNISGTVAVYGLAMA